MTKPDTKNEESKVATAGGCLAFLAIVVWVVVAGCHIINDNGFDAEDCHEIPGSRLTTQPDWTGKEYHAPIGVGDLWCEWGERL